MMPPMLRDVAHPRPPWVGADLFLLAHPRSANCCVSWQTARNATFVGQAFPEGPQSDAGPRPQNAIENPSAVTCTGGGARSSPCDAATAASTIPVATPMPPTTSAVVDTTAKVFTRSISDWASCGHEVTDGQRSSRSELPVSVRIPVVAPT